MIKAPSIPLVVFMMFFAASAGFIFLMSAAGQVFIVIALYCIAITFISIVLLFAYFVLAESTERVLASVIAAIISLAIAWSIVITHWPLRLAFAIVESDFDEIAQQVESGKFVPLPQNLGSLRIREVEKDHRTGLVCIYLVGLEGHRKGFIQASGKLPFSVQSRLKLGDNWVFVVEDSR